MPVQIVGNQPTGVIPYSPARETTSNPQVFSRLNEPTARNWDSLGRPTNLPEFRSQPSLSLSDRLSGRSAPAPTPNVAGGYRPSSVPTGNPNLSARLAGRAAPVVPGGIPAAAEVAARSPILAPIPRFRLPSGTSGGLLIGTLAALPTEAPRLRDLISNPQQYWEQQDRQLQQDYPFLFPTSRSQPDGRSTPSERPALAVIPFQGGQLSGTLYNVTVIQSINGEDTPVLVQAQGPISGIRREFTSLDLQNRISFYLLTGAGEVGLGGRVGAGDISTGINYSISSIVRADGEPDTGGDPAPVVDPSASPRPGLASPTAPYTPTTPSRVPNAVPLNNPTVQTAPGVRPAPINAPTPNPFAPPAPAPTPTVEARPTPTAAPHAPPAPSNLGQTTTWRSPVNPTSEDASPVPGLIAAAGLGLLGGFALGRTTTTTTSPPTPIPTPTPTPTPFVCRFRDDPYSYETNVKAGRIEALSVGIDAFQTAQIGVIQNKLGAQIVGGISGKLGRMGALASKTWNFLQVDRVLNVFTWFGVLHNAYMLSNNLGQTLFSAISNTLDAIGIQKVDEEGNEEAYDIGEIVSKFSDNWAKSVFGVSTWEGIKDEWKKVNRIYQAATNLLNSLQSMTYAVLEGLETVGNYVAKIGNAARIFGVFTEKAFNPMKDNFNFKGGKFFRFLERAEEFVENIDSISSNVVDVQQTAADCVEQKTTLTTAINDFENTKKTEEETKKANSQGATISPSDEQKPET